MHAHTRLKTARAAMAACLALVVLPGMALASGPRIDRETEFLKAQVAAQQAQIDELRRMLDDQRKRLDAVIGERAGAPPSPSDVPEAPAPVVMRMPAAAGATPFAAPRQSDARQAGPLNFRIGSVDFTPSGYMEFAAVVRDRNVGSGVATNYGSIPFDNTVNGNLREYRLSAQTSRLGLRMDSVVAGATVRGYLETDFLGIVPGNVAVTSNSDTLRLRLFWADVRKNRLEFLAGQSFTMLTPNRKGLSALPSDLFLPQVVDPNLHVGMLWNRNPQVRFVYHANDATALGVSLEATEQYGGGGAGSGIVTLPSELAPYYDSQMNTGSAGYATPNPHQDFVAKIALDPSFGDRALHIEAGGVLAQFAFYNPLSGTGYRAAGGGGAVNVNLELARRLRVFANTFYSRGAGRYLVGLGPDVIIKGDGSPSPVGASSVLAGIEYQAGRRTAVQGYWGTARFERNVAIDPATGGEVGFGYAGSPSNHNREISQGTLGFSHSFWQDPKLGGLMVMAQFSHLFREPWYAAAGAPGRADVNMFYLKIRYSLPGAPPELGTPR
jgi:hypothetical protein